jgi:putative hemolysin
MSSENTTSGAGSANYDIRPDVLNFEDISKMVPALAGHRKLVERVMHWLKVDEVNAVHGRNCHAVGVDFSHALIEDEFKIKVRVDNEEVLSRFPTGAFITVSNHPFGALDGIILLHMVGKYRPDFKVMVNLILNQISAMRPNFIAVDALASDDPEKKKVSMQGIREAMMLVKSGSPLGFFPAGAVSKVQKDLHIRDREWQSSIIRLVKQLKVPVVPIYFHGHNSTWFNILGMISWKLRTLRLPAEVFRRRGKSIHMSIGEPITVDEQTACPDMEALGKLLRERTYALEKIK